MLMEDCESPVSLQTLLLSPFGLMAIQEKYNVRRFATLARIGGAGYRTFCSLASRPSRRWERLRVMSEKQHSGQSSPLEFWLCRGYPCGPY